MGGSGLGSEGVSTSISRFFHGVASPLSRLLAVIPRSACACVCACAAFAVRDTRSWTVLLALALPSCPVTVARSLRKPTVSPPVRRHLAVVACLTACFDCPSSPDRESTRNSAAPSRLARIHETTSPVLSWIAGARRYPCPCLDCLSSLLYWYLCCTCLLSALARRSRSRVRCCSRTNAIGNGQRIQPALHCTALYITPHLSRAAIAIPIPIPHHGARRRLLPAPARRPARRRRPARL
jgi:hypothetical protein